MSNSLSDTRKFVLMNIPHSYNAHLITDYIEATLDVDVVDVKVYPFIPGKALVFLEDDITDFQAASDAVKKECLEGQEVTLVSTQQEIAIVVLDIDFEVLKKDFLINYLEKKFFNEENGVKSCKICPDHNVAVVHFHKKCQRVLSDILKMTIHTPLPSEYITIEPFYTNFHDCIPTLLSEDEESSSDSEISSDELHSNSDVDHKNSSESISDVEEKSESENSENERNHISSLKKDNDDSDIDDESEEESDSLEENDSSGSERDNYMDKKIPVHSRYQGRGRGGIQRSLHLTHQKEEVVEYENINIEKCVRKKYAFRGRGSFAMSQRGGKINDAKKSSNDQGKSSRRSHSHREISLSNSSSILYQEGAKEKRNKSHSDSSNEEDSSKRLSERNSSPHASLYLSQSAEESEPTNLKINKLHSLSSENNVISIKSQKIESKEFIWNSSNPSKQNNSTRKASLPDDNQCVSQPKKQFKSFPISSRNVTSKDSDDKIDFSSSQSYKPQKRTKLSEHYKESIDKLEEELKHLSEENARLKDKPEQSEVKQDMTPLQAKLLQPFFSTHQVECLIRYAVEEKAAIITGPDNLVKEFQLKLMLELRKIKEDSVAISKEMFTVLTKEKGKKFLLNLELNGALTAVENNSVKVAATDENVLLEALNILKSKLDGKETCSSDVDIPSEKFDHLKLRLEHDLLVCVILEEKDITVVGVKEDVDIALRDVNKLLEDIGHNEKCFEVGEPEAKFFYCCLEEKIYSALKLVEITEQLMTETKVTLKFKGQKKDVHEAYQCLLDIKDNVTISKWNLKDDFNEHELLLIAKNYESDRTKLETCDYKEKYLCTFHISDEVNDSSPDQSNIEFSEKSFFESPDLTFDLSDSSKLIIKSEGNITKEKSDILVSLLGPEHDMRKTAVGKAFNSACRSHYKYLNECIESDPSAKVFTVYNCGKLKCLAVCHIVLSKWDSDNPDQSASILTEAFKSVFSSAKNLQAKSVSFPTVGCGRAFKFPPSKVAEIFLQSLKDEKVETFLERITFLASERELFDILKTSTPSICQGKEDTPEEIQTPAESDIESDYEEDSEGEEIVYPIDRKNFKNAQMKIFTLSKDIVEGLKNEKKKSIREQFLQGDLIQQSCLKRWPKSSWKKIVKEAVDNNVWVEQQQNKITKDIEFCLTGQKEKVLQVKSFIHQEFLDVTKYLPKRQLISSDAPARGTVEFMKFAIESDERFPSYWSINSNKKCLRKLREGRIIEPGEFDLLVSVDPATKAAISNLFMQTMDQSRIGHGADAHGIAYTTFNIIDVQRVENPELFDTYRRERERLFKKMVNMDHVCKNVGALDGSHGDVATAALLTDSLKKELYHEINEHYLFHGAKVDTITTLINSGLDPRVSNETCMFGKGIYTAEKSTKADQYADIRGQRVPNGTPLKMILTRLLLGNVFVCDSNHKSVRSKDSIKLSRPPCMNCAQDKCTCPDQVLFDSVLGDGKWLFREFVVYHSNCCYPEYVITYKRV